MTAAIVGWMVCIATVRIPVYGRRPQIRTTRIREGLTASPRFGHVVYAVRFRWRRRPGLDGWHDLAAAAADQATVLVQIPGPNKWVRHTMGEAMAMYGGACTADVNDDGHMDVVATDLWLNNGHGSGWTFHETGLPGGVHDMQAADFNGDGKQDFLVFDQRKGLAWYELPDDPTKKWISHGIARADYAGHKVHATGAPSATADLDGDGDTDIAAVKGWFENGMAKGCGGRTTETIFFRQARPARTGTSRGDMP